MATAAASTFEGFQPEAVDFLAELAAHNDRAWFQPRKAEYERLLKEPLEALCAAANEAFRARGVPLSADPTRSPFRIYRDVRFSKDKSPYKTHVAASFPWVGDDRSRTEHVHASGGYFHLEPGNVYVGGGVWHPDPGWLKRFRERIDADAGSFTAIVEAPAFVKAFGAVSDDGESLKRVPSGYAADHPAGDLLRKKNVTFGRRLSDAEAQSPALPDLLAESFAVGTPLLRYLASV